MKRENRPSKTPTRREPKTQRGRETRDEILIAARQLVSERWVDEVPFIELAAAAGVARASLLHVFPNWRNVLYDLFADEVDILDESFAAALALKRARPGDRAYAMLVPLLNRAEKTGRLYPNFRSAMFAWHGDPSEEDLSEASVLLPPGREMLAAFTRIHLNDHYAAVEELLGVQRDESLKPNEFGSAPIGECLVNFTLDLAAGCPTYFATFDFRRETLRSTIDVIAAGLRRSKPPGTRRPRT
jgi:AcrR family transcriptional regulator